MGESSLFGLCVRKRMMVMMLIAVSCATCLSEWIGSKFLSTIGLLYLTFHLSDLLTKYLYNKLPRQLIENTNDKAVLITGCDSGFGHNLACRLDSMGFKVYAGCLNVQGEGAQDLKKKCSPRLNLLPLDVTKDDQVSSAFRLVSSTLEDRKLWAIVNNAGIGCMCEIEWCPLDTFQRIFDVNTLGIVRVTKAFLPMLRESQGRVVVMASMAGRVTMAGFTPYAMSKVAAIAFSDGLRREMRKWSISVHLIEPTLYKTNISVVEPLYQSLKNYWDQCPDEIKSNYGPDYLEDFKTVLKVHMSKARPEEKISEVVDDMMDAVAGTTPQLRYVPAMDVQFRSRVLVSMPVEVQDHFLDKFQPQTPPAAVVAKRGILPPLKSPYNGLRSKPVLQRHMSMPIREKNLPETLNEEDEKGQVLESPFKF